MCHALGLRRTRGDRLAIDFPPYIFDRLCMSPLVILIVGIVTVLGLIIVLRLNAFLALITAALIVSLMAPGSIGNKTARVAEAFGSTAGKIGVVIALAAIIGQCMMDSGAADRIVRAFLRLLGQKQASVALMGSGFVLAVPVFFDTVFYLLVPLARSLYRRTQSNFLLYILAIAAGGAITHTLVPPTPGPLVMASTLGVDIGLMIMIGTLVAIPAAIAGLMFARTADRIMPLPMRPLAGESEVVSLPDHLQPPLWMAILPVALPVLLIGANTGLETIADAEAPTRLTVQQVSNWDGLVTDLAAAPDSQEPRLQPAAVLMEQFSPELRQQIESAAAAGTVAPALQEQIVAELNEEVIADKKFFDPADERFDTLLLHRDRIKTLLADEALMQVEAQALLTESGSIGWDERQRLNRLQTINELASSDLSSKRTVIIERFNRLLLEAAYPQYFEPHNWNTPWREAADWGQLVGNANMALLLSAAISILMYVRQRKASRREVASMIETSLMSGGVIILITSAGGAFGEMLKVAEIGDAVKDLFGTSAQGLMLLVLGFGVSALLKIAQGSSTVAMITASAMLASMVAQAGELPYNAVYLCTAIGAGSLIGSWMNDSGFWIVAKMSGFTEEEALKTWTLLLVVMGLVAFGVTVLLSYLLPLTAVTAGA